MRSSLMIALMLSMLAVRPVAGETAAAKDGRPSPADLERWQVETSHDPERPFSLHVTDVPARFEGALAAGDGVIAFGTGGYNGVGYMVVGDSEAREIPDARRFRASYVRVAGKKIVLVENYQVAVFDTATAKLTRLPAESITLGLPVKGMQEANPIDTSGYLVATINDAHKVADGAMIDEPLRACDVTLGDGMVAFKTGSGNDTTIGYATFGRSAKP